MLPGVGATVDGLLGLDEALAGLPKPNRSKRELVKLRFFAGLTLDRSRRRLGISLATADRYWTFARLAVRGDGRRDREDHRQKIGSR